MLAERRSGYGGCYFVLFLLLIAYLVLSPVFYEARESAIESRRFDQGRRLALAAKMYAGAHKGILPGVNWTEALETSDPGLIADVWREQDGARLGYAAVPGVLGKPIDRLPPETILFIETRSGRLNDVARDLGELGGRLRKDTAIAVTAENVGQAFPVVSVQPLARIGVQFGRQVVPGLK